MSNTIQGIPASSGIAIAKAYRLENPELSVDKKTIDNAQAEVERFEKAVEISKNELEKIKEHAHKELGADKA
jgi:phosphotransferase system enzyme I (PtsI)